jgi:hypothetical protein
MLVFENFRPYVIDFSRIRGKNNAPKTKTLFYELSKGKLYNYPIFTLDNYFDLCYSATENTPEQYFWSLRRLYLEAEDPHEYDFASVVFGCWDHWTKLTRSSFFTPYVEAWREELSIKLASKGVKSLLYKATGGDVVASKFLASKEWHKIHSKIETKAKTSKVDNDIADDLARIRSVVPLKVVK